jgi:hypothetical protein
MTASFKEPMFIDQHQVVSRTGYKIISSATLFHTFCFEEQQSNRF